MSEQKSQVITDTWVSRDSHRPLTGKWIGFTLFQPRVTLGLPVSIPTFVEDAVKIQKAQGPKSTKSRKNQIKKNGASVSTRKTVRHQEPESTPVTVCEKENMFLSRYNYCEESEENRLNFRMRVALDPLLLTSCEGQDQLGCFVTPIQEPSAFITIDNEPVIENHGASAPGLSLIHISEPTRPY